MSSFTLSRPEPRRRRREDGTTGGVTVAAEMRVIGLAGKAGSGKSAVAKRLTQRPGVAWINLDEVAWTTYAPGTPVHRRLVEAFGESIRTDGGAIDRQRLAQQALTSPAQTEILNAIVHPAVSAELRNLIRRHREQGTRILIVEGALLASSAYVDRTELDRIVWLDVPDEVRAARLTSCGRAEHQHRGASLAPQGDVQVVSGVGSIEEVAERLWRAVAERGDEAET